MCQLPSVDHSILLLRLHGMFGISGKAFEWFLSYLSDRFQSVSFNGRRGVNVVRGAVFQKITT